MVRWPAGAGSFAIESVVRPLAIILVADADAHTPSERDLAEFFPLSPADSRLTAARLAITTVRTQLSSVLRMVGVSRQAELIRALSHIPVVPASLP